MENLPRWDINQLYWDIKFLWGVEDDTLDIKVSNADFSYMLIIYSRLLQTIYSINRAKAQGWDMKFKLTKTLDREDYTPTDGTDEQAPNFS